MQQMQDKEFDQLFKDRFEAAEVTPSPGLWGAISAELEPKPKRAFPVYWMVAALAVMVGGITLFSPETEKISLSAPAGLAEVNAVKTVNPSAVKPALAQQEKTYESTPLVIAPRAEITEQEIKAFNKLQPEVAVVRPVEETPLIIEETALIKPKTQQTDRVIASMVVPDDVAAITEVAQPERRGIRNVGDIVNYVVDKVDKRENKLLKFNTDDDDNSSLIAINIGFIKLNSKRYK